MILAMRILLAAAAWSQPAVPAASTGTAVTPPQVSTITLPGIPAISTFTAISTQTAVWVSSSAASGVNLSTAAVAVSTAAALESPEVPRPWVLGEIAVQGNKNVKFTVVRSQVKAKKGDLYDKPDLDRDIQSIYGLGNFERVQADVTLTQAHPENFRKVAGAEHQILLTFIVKEKPLARKIIFEGNKKVGKGTLGDAATIKAKDPVDSIKLREDEDKILEKYKDKGFLEATVSSRVDLDTSTMMADVIYTIVEGPKSKIKEIRIETVKSFKPKKVLKQMKNRRKKVFLEKELPEDVKKIETFYLNNGYLDVSVGSAAWTYNPDKTEITIVIPLTEGRQYKFGDSSFSGNIIYTSTELAKAIEYRRGKIFNQERYEETVRGVQELYAEKGRLHARVKPNKTLNPKTDLMDVEYKVTEGNIVYIDHVDLAGNKATKTRVLKRELIVKPGEAFSASRIRRSRERIMNLGFIDDVGVDLQPRPDPEKVDVIFDVVEGKPGLLTAGAAFSSVDGFIGTLSLAHMNLWGVAHRSNVQWQFGGRVQDFTVSYYMPWLDAYSWTPWKSDKSTSLGLEVFNNRRIQPFQTSLSAYTLKQRGGSINLGPRFQADKYHLDLAYTYRQITIDSVQDLFRGILSEGTQVQSVVGAAMARDTRDNIWDTTRGSRHSLGAQFSGGPVGGHIHFFKPSLNNSIYHTVFSIADYPFVLAMLNRLSYITPFGPTKVVPVNERFFVGGQDSLRGYAASGEVGFPSGGKVSEVLNVEFGFPLARERRRSIVKLVAFFDMGSAWDRPQDIKMRIGTGMRDLKTNVGIGLRFTTPAFPIRLDYGYGLNHRPGERLYQINFGLGNLF